MLSEGGPAPLKGVFEGRSGGFGLSRRRSAPLGGGRTEECAARAFVEPRGARERLGEAQLSGLWRGGLAARGAAVSLASTSACWRARSRSRSRRGCWRRWTNFVLVDHSLAASRALGYPSLARGEDRI